MFFFLNTLCKQMRIACFNNVIQQALYTPVKQSTTKSWLFLHQNLVQFSSLKSCYQDVNPVSKSQLYFEPPLCCTSHTNNIVRQLKACVYVQFSSKSLLLPLFRLSQSISLFHVIQISLGLTKAVVESDFQTISKATGTYITTIIMQLKTQDDYAPFTLVAIYCRSAVSARL